MSGEVVLGEEPQFTDWGEGIPFHESGGGSVNRELGPRGVALDALYELGSVHPKIHVLPCRVMWESSKQGGAWRLQGLGT